MKEMWRPWESELTSVQENRDGAPAKTESVESRQPGHQNVGVVAKEDDPPSRYGNHTQRSPAGDL